MGDVPNLDLLKKHGELVLYQTTFPEQTFEHIKDADIAITCKVVIDKELMEKSPQLKLICIAATGLNNVDVEFAKRKNIVIKNVVNYSSHSVAQTTFAIILSLLHKIRYYDDFVKSGSYASNDMFTHYGPDFWELSDKHFGIIGMGNIGKRVAAIAECFGAKVIYYSTSGNNNHSQYRRLELDQLMKVSDIISVHSPLNDKTNNLITLDKLKLMKPSALIFNTGRGGIVNEADLAEALNQNMIAGAGVDVYSKEPVREDNPLLHVKDKNKIILTPHIAWISIEARTLLIEKIAFNIDEFVKNKN